MEGGGVKRKALESAGVLEIFDDLRPQSCYKRDQQSCPAEQESVFGKQMYSVPYGREMLVMLAGYALGCFTSGYYLVRWRTGEDIRLLGSGSVGATNVSRVLGWPGFCLTVSSDFAKGMLAVWLTDYFRINPTATVL